MNRQSRQFTKKICLRAQDSRLTQRYINQVSQLSHCEWHGIVIVYGLLTMIQIMKKFNVGLATNYENQLLSRESWVIIILFRTTAGVIKISHSGSKIAQSLFVDHLSSFTGCRPFSHCLHSSDMWPVSYWQQFLADTGKWVVSNSMGGWIHQLWGSWL